MTVANIPLFICFLIMSTWAHGDVKPSWGYCTRAGWLFTETRDKNGKVKCDIPSADQCNNGRGITCNDTLYDGSICAEGPNTAEVCNKLSKKSLDSTLRLKDTPTNRTLWMLEINSFKDYCRKPDPKDITECAATIPQIEALENRQKIMAADAPSTCKPIRLDEKGGAMEHVPPRDQVDLGICYSEMAAELMDAYRFSHGDKDYEFRTNALPPALYSSSLDDGNRARNQRGYSIRDKGKEFWFEGGATGCEAFASLKEKGLCEDFTTPEYYSGVAAEWTRYSHLPDSAETCPCNSLADKAKNLYKTAVFNVRSSLNDDGFVTYFRNEIASDCKRLGEKAAPQQPQCQAAPLSSPEAVTQKLNQVLDKDRMPAGVTICSQALKYDYKYEGVRFGRHGSYIQTENICKPHAALIIGRRWNTDTKQCEYALRNSWGGFHCGNYDDFYKDKCEEGAGNVWVPASILSNNVDEIITVKDK